MGNVAKSLLRITAGLLFFESLPCRAQTWTQKGGSLSSDTQGFTYHPSVAASANGTIYATWTQDTNPSIDQYSTPYAAIWNAGTQKWTLLGGAIGHNPGDTVNGRQGYAPSIVVVGTTPYVAYYESSGGGWIPSGSGGIGSSVFVSHWNGLQWVQDTNTKNPLNGAVNPNNCAATPPMTCHGRDPKMAYINGVLYVAWTQEVDKEDNIGPPSTPPTYDAVFVDHLSGGNYVQDGSSITIFGLNPDNGHITDFAIAGTNSPFVALAEYRITSSGNAIQNNPGVVQVYQLSGGSWVQVGGNLNISASGYTNYLALTIMNGVPYVAWQERALTGLNQIYVKHWTGTTWSADGGVLNVDPVNGEAGRPALTNDGTKVWLAWAEGALNQKSQLYIRSLSAGVWSSASSSLNIDSTNGVAAEPAMTLSNGAPQLAWVENDFNSHTKQLYLKATDAGAPQATTLTQYGSDGPAVTIPDNTWTYMNPGGDVLPSNDNVSDRGGLSYFGYDPGIKKGIAWIFYHGPFEAENQNALAEYDFKRNRWDTIEITEAAWSEYFPGVGHTFGLFVVDTNHHLLLDRGDATLNNGTGYQTYTYDLLAGRGKRMMPQSYYSKRPNCATSAFDPDDDLMLSVQADGAFFYNHNTNTWTVASSTFPGSFCTGMVYDTQNHLFVMWGGDFGATRSSDTWTFNPKTRVWTQMHPAVSPPPLREPFMAYDSVHGVSMITQGYDGPVGYANTIGGSARISTSVWVYNLPQNTWNQIGNMPEDPTLFEAADGMYLTYDTDDQLFLLRSGNDLTKLVAYRYNPATLPPTPFVQLSTNVVYFQPQAIGTTSPPVTIKLTNVGTGPLAINNISLAAGAFSQTNNCPVAPATLAYAASCAITVTFKPISAGNFFGFVSISDNTPDGPQILKLYGSASGPPDAFAPARPTGLVLE